MADLKSASELYDLGKTEVQNQDPSLTDFNPGSLLDIIVGLMALMTAEVQRVTVEAFKKTFVETADGPEVTGGADDLERLLVDHFGSEFERPASTKASGVVQFTRDNTDNGDCIIPAGTIVKTAVNSEGIAQRFSTEADVTMTGTSISASVTAVLAGFEGNVEADEVTIIESSLTDSTIEVNNSDEMSGGEAEATDAEYREFARNLLVSLRGATLAALRAKALTVPGVELATGIEFVQTVIEWDESGGTPVGNAFKIVRAKLYIADANGTANPTLVSAVEAAIAYVRACGVRVDVIGASAVVQNVTLSLTLDAGGPNYATLQSDAQMILDDVTGYLQGLAIGANFVRASLKTYLMAIWGPSGSGDLTDLSVVSPVGDVTVGVNEKIIPGTIGTQ